MKPPAIYTPPRGLRTSLDDFRDYLNGHYRTSLASYDDLHAFSINRANDFWMSLWKFAGIKASVQPSKMNETIPIDQFPLFFEDAKLNFAENMLSGKDHDTALVDMNETNMSSPRIITWREWREIVRSYADALLSSGVRKGDVIAVIGSNCARSLSLLLATAAVGGIYSSFATDIGEKALQDRLGQLHPRFVLAETSYSYNGKLNNVSEKINNVFTKLEKSADSELIVIGDSEGVRCKCTSFESFLSRGKGRELVFEQVPFNTPFIVMFSSGTTGTPKGIVHTHGGLVANGFKEHLLHNSFGPKDIHFHYTNIGWTLWNISMGALFCATTLVLYDGSPFYPSPEGFLRAIFATGVNAFGAGPRYFSELQKYNVKPREFAPQLHSIFSTGAVLTPAVATWVAEAFGPVCLMSMSGGTELSGSFVHGTRSLPTYPGEIAVKALAMDIDVFSPEGKSLPLGESGELVCKKPFPNSPIFFWNDPGKKRYRASYFEAFPNVWTHGDFIKIDPETKGIYVLGRSDGVLNPSGVRFGSSEIYSIMSHSFTREILDSLCVSQQRANIDSTERVYLFVKLASGLQLHDPSETKNLEQRLREQIAKDLSRRHVPEYIFALDEIPYNANGKKLEIPVKAVLCKGREAVLAAKVTAEERAMLGKFEEYFEVERFVARGRAKL